MDGYLDLLDKNNSFGIEFLEAFGSKTMCDTHLHNHYELYYQIVGERYIFLKDKFYYIRPGDFILIAKNEIHKTVTANQNMYRRMLINFKDSFLNDIINSIDFDFSTLFTQNHIFKINIGDENYIKVLLFKMLNEYENKPYGYESLLKLQLSEILTYLMTCQKYDHSKGLKFPNAQYNKISNISEYINKNYNQKLTLGSLAQKYNMSSYYLSRTFKDVLGITLIEYINFTRISASKNFIKNTNLSITEIAFKVGFESSTYFTKVFKSITNITPLKYRSMYNEK